MNSQAETKNVLKHVGARLPPTRFNGFVYLRHRFATGGDGRTNFIFRIAENPAECEVD
jgi:hypothetical protein